jgi:hypothetical protein
MTLKVNMGMLYFLIMIYVEYHRYSFTIDELFIDLLLLFFNSRSLDKNRPHTP